MISTEQIEALAKVDTNLKNLFERKLACDYQQFVHILYEDLDDSLAHLTQSRHLYKNSSEDQLSLQIISFLKGRYYDAEHDPQHGGHVDILVKDQWGKNEWIGEAKIWGGVEYAMDGWNQLHKRYSAGTHRDNHGGILLYVKVKNARQKLEDWVDHLKSSISGLEVQDDSNSLIKTTTSIHEGSGLEFYVRHMAVVLNHNS